MSTIKSIDVVLLDRKPALSKAGAGRKSPATLTLLMILAVATVTLRATTVGLPNGSFELPGTSFATNSIDDWQKSPQPVWFDPMVFGGSWDQLTGVFLNTPATNSSHIDNCDGNQAAFFFALPEVALFQDYNSIYGTNTTPSHAFDAKFEAGKSYTLTVGVIGGGGGMINGATMQISLYYRDAASNLVTVAVTTITNDPALFPTNTHFVDFQAQVPVVKPGDAWAGRNIGIQLLSTIGFAQQFGGYWDLDNVRLAALSEPLFTLNQTLAGSELRISWPSVTGFQYQMKISRDLQTWLDDGAILTGNGGELFRLVPTTGRTNGYFQVLATPVP